jgi:hypothetical protein
MTFKTISRSVGTALVVTLAFIALQFRAADAVAVCLGNMKADSILFLGNSVTACPQVDNTPWWGLSASAPARDYVHLLAGKINAATGGSLALNTADMDRWYYGNPLPNWSGNVLNIADLFERNYNTWDNARIQNQFDAKPDIVVLQFGENMAGGTLTQFQTALGTLLTGLKNSSNPQIFMTSYVMAEPTGVASIKQQLCAADPTHRVFVDLTAVMQTPANVGAYGHPSDPGMAVIANTIYGAMVVHSAPEPGSVVLLLSGLLGLLIYGWWKHVQHQLHYRPICTQPSVA